MIQFIRANLGFATNNSPQQIQLTQGKSLAHQPNNYLPSPRVVKPNIGSPAMPGSVSLHQQTVTIYAVKLAIMKTSVVIWILTSIRIMVLSSCLILDHSQQMEV
ncbi:hypothetical protein [Legionella fallonii]|uniref:Uncharacterized protein n=1 Tax=Legionella fallonii LLAP-10 TaxID=1212491 RepID=A0A098G7M4_9GAMM|nr:hypothetical protein [Legionella fallonii]CEG58457.1 protein of unknown function [Legionella fallonii LLAP-10]